MREKVAIFKAFVSGDVSLKYVDKIPVKRTPGDTTIVGHN
jgi:hypothetical protein